MKKLHALLLASAVLAGNTAMADNYQIDTEHTFIQFRVKHLGYSWLYGNFNEFSGNFSYDPAKPATNKVEVDIKTASVDTNHAERNKHIRSGDFLNADKHPTVHFVSTGYKSAGGDKAELSGDLTFNGVTKPIILAVSHIAGGDDPWGGFRQGFEGHATLMPADYGMDIAANLGPAAAEVELILSVEGIRQ